MQLWVDSTNLGNITVSSDYRIKTNVQPLPTMWDRLKTLSPVSYNHKAFGDYIKADSKERWGFVAHELQDALIEDAATAKRMRRT